MVRACAGKVRPRLFDHTAKGNSIMRPAWLSLAALLVYPALFLLSAAEEPAGGSVAPVLNRVRFFPAPGREEAMVGGRFSGSNISATNGFKVLAEIKAAPAAGKWTELTFANDKVYRWIRYESPRNSRGAVAEVEFCTGRQMLTGAGFGTTGWQKALDGDTTTTMAASDGDGHYVGLDLGTQITAVAPTLTPPPGNLKGAVQVAVKSVVPGATVRYTLDGTIPGPDGGMPYTSPIAVDKTTTIVAVAFQEGRAASVPIGGTYLMESSVKPGLSTFHIGNSLTETTNQFATFAKTAGILHDRRTFTAGGALTKQLWAMGTNKDQDRWKSLDNLKQLDHFTIQPRDFDLAAEVDHDVRFLNVVRQKFPDFQPWLYIEWVERNRGRPSDKGTVPSSQMKTLYPALTWEESMAAMLLYGEELQRRLREVYKEGKPPRILPSCLAMGWIKNLIDNGKFPGAAPGTFYPLLFSDDVHPNVNGGYLVDLTWYAAFYKQSPEGKVLPIGTVLNAEQATVMQRLAWDAVKNYPDCGLYEDGTTPVGKPEFGSAPAALKAVTPVTLSSATPGAWFRYTLDGSTPTRTSGYVYCGVISVRPGMTVKAVAYKSGMADSPVVEVTYPK
jgi:hypothetical protein